MLGIECPHLLTILKFLIMSSLSLCFVSEGRRDNASCARDLEPQPTHGPASHCDPRTDPCHLLPVPWPPAAMATVRQWGCVPYEHKYSSPVFRVREAAFMLSSGLHTEETQCDWWRASKKSRKSGQGGKRGGVGGSICSRPAITAQKVPLTLARKTGRRWNYERFSTSLKTKNVCSTRLLDDQTSCARNYLCSNYQ